MLQPLGTKIKRIDQVIMRTCESCGNQVESSQAINIIIVVGSPGHANLAPFQCEHEEHWACSIDCWKKIAHACIDEHVHEILCTKHRGMGRDSVHYERALNYGDIVDEI